MKKKRFFELLNLYLDCEIDSRSANELENEILSNRKHRSIYSEYCRIHRATRLVFERFRSGDVASHESEITAGPHFPIASFGGAKRRPKIFRFPAVATATGIAAVMAIAFVVLHNVNSRKSSPATGGIALAGSEPVQALPTVTFQAPYAADQRVDPYFLGTSYPGSNPFAFSTDPVNARVEGFSSSLQNATSLRLGASNEMRPEQIEFDRIQLGQPESRVFRSNPDAAPVSFEPVGFEVHR